MFTNYPYTIPGCWTSACGGLSKECAGLRGKMLYLSFPAGQSRSEVERRLLSGNIGFFRSMFVSGPFLHVWKHEILVILRDSNKGIENEKP